jgi:RNA polymerase sigma factor (TIGR02999 family)
MKQSAHQVTQLLEAWGEGSPDALDRLAPLVYDELHRLAHRYMARERPGHTLVTTALVNEAYLKLVETAHLNFRNRAHFFAVCSKLMRRILVEWARTRHAQKRGGAVPRLALDEALVVARQPDARLVALDDALQALAEFDARKAEVVELRFFGGLSVEETAAVLEVSPDTIMRDWRLAKTWLKRELERNSGDEG